MSCVGLGRSNACPAATSVFCADCDAFSMRDDNGVVAAVNWGSTSSSCTIRDTAQVGRVSALLCSRLSSPSQLRHYKASTTAGGEMCICEVMLVDHQTLPFVLEHFCQAL